MAIFVKYPSYGLIRGVGGVGGGGQKISGIHIWYIFYHPPVDLDELATSSVHKVQVIIQ